MVSHFLELVNGTLILSNTVESYSESCPHLSCKMWESEQRERFGSSNRQISLGQRVVSPVVRRCARVHMALRSKWNCWLRRASHRSLRMERPVWVVPTDPIFYSKSTCGPEWVEASSLGCQMDGDGTSLTGSVLTPSRQGMIWPRSTKHSRRCRVMRL